MDADGPAGFSRERIRDFVTDRWRGSFNELVGLEFVDGGEGFARLRLPVRPEVLQPTGLIHGGAVATLVDVTSGIAAHLSYPGADLVTVEMKVNFLAGVRGGRLEAESAALHMGRRTSVWQVRVSDGAGRLAAFGTATYMVVKPPRGKPPPGQAPPGGGGGGG